MPMACCTDCWCRPVAAYKHATGPGSVVAELEASHWRRVGEVCECVRACVCVCGGGGGSSGFPTQILKGCIFGRGILVNAPSRLRSTAPFNDEGL